MALTKEHRDSLPASDFAVPGKRELPFHDETHTRMAWKMVDKTKDLTPGERSSAKRRILKRAEEQGIDTKDWNVSAASEIKIAGSAWSVSCMSLDVPFKDHPNKVPFKGVLVKLDEPSDAPPHGSSGKQIILPKSVAEAAIDSLINMAVDFTPNYDGHDARRKFGVITGANVVGNEIQVEGFLYAADFPTEVEEVQAEKERMGLSFEAQVSIRSMDDNPLVIENCIFTGAAVLYKNKAAYSTTSISAKKSEQKQMSDEILKELKEMRDEYALLKADLAAAKAEKLEAEKVNAGSVQHLVKPHANALRAAAAGMCAAGMGMHPKNGHVAHLHAMADHMEAEGVLGRMPHIYQGPDFLSASNEKDANEEENKESKEVAELKASLESFKTELSDLKKAKFDAAASPERRTLPASVDILLKKHGISAGSSDKKLTVFEVDKSFKTAGMSVQQRLAAKVAMEAAGQIE